MAQRSKKTKAELAAEAVAYQAKLQAEAVAKYPSMLMETLERSAKFNYELTVKDAKFMLRDPNSNGRWTLTPLYTNESQETLETLVWDLEIEENELAERERKAQIRLTALNKLSREERELLGL